MTTQTTTNEAAERLRVHILNLYGGYAGNARNPQGESTRREMGDLLETALAAAKAEGAREAVERIRAALHNEVVLMIAFGPEIDVVLDEEAAR